MFRYKRIITNLGYALLLCFSFSVSAEISVRVDRNPVNLNESFQLIFSADESPDDDPDFQVLEADFEILNKSQSSNISMINGSFSKSITWTLTVMAKRAGVLTLPPVPFGDDSSPVLRLMVNKGRTPLNRGRLDNDDIFIQVSAEPEQAIVQSQIIYTLRVYRKVNIAQANLTEPELDDALVEKLGEDSTFNTDYNGENYVVTERKYAIFPQKSGLLTIDPVILTAEVISDSGRSRGFFNRQITRTRRVASEPLGIDVLPIPEGVNAAHWLPAEQVHLEQKWSGDLAALTPGEPITRTITLIAKGATVGQLPELQTDDLKTDSESGGRLKSYPDQPVLREQAKDGSMYALREEKTAIIPSKPGVYRLPAIAIPWWNTRTGTLQYARIPESTLTATGAAEDIASMPAPDFAKPEIASTDKDSIEVQPETGLNIWFWIAIGLAIGWLSTAFIWFRGKSEHQQPEPSSPKTPDFDAKALSHACHLHDPIAAKDELLKWGQMQWRLTSLASIASQCQPELQAEILALNERLYSQNSQSWHGEKLLHAFKHQNRKKTTDKQGNDQLLEPLYKA